MLTGRRFSRAAIRCLAAALWLAGGGSQAAPAANPSGFVHPPIGAEAPVPVAPRLPPATVMARFGAGVITAGDLEAAVGAVQGPERLEYATPGPLRELVQALVDQRLMAAAAGKLGLDRDPAVLARQG